MKNKVNKNNIRRNKKIPRSKVRKQLRKHPSIPEIEISSKKPYRIAFKIIPRKLKSPYQIKSQLKTTEKVQQKTLSLEQKVSRLFEKFKHLISKSDRGDGQ